MDNFIDFLNGNGVDDAAGLMADIIIFFDDPDSFNELPEAERRSYMARVDAAWALIAG
jgi:hypothetical protein